MNDPYLLIVSDVILLALVIDKVVRYLRLRRENNEAIERHNSQVAESERIGDGDA